MKSGGIAIRQLREAVMRIPPDRLTESRSRALSRLKDIGLPTVSDEDWKYTDLATPIDISNRWLAAGAVSPPNDEALETLSAITSSIDANWLVIANGVIDTSRFDDGGAIGVSLLSDSGEVAFADNPLNNLNLALLADGVRLDVHSATEKPIGVLVFDSSETNISVSQANISIDVAAGCDAEIIEYQASSGDLDSYCNSVISLNIGEAAHVAYVRIQNRRLEHTQTARLSVAMGADGRLQMAGYDLGGGFIRNDVDIDLGEPGARASFDGLYLAGDGQHIDNHTRVDHRVGPASSFQEYRGILGGRCRCVWNGKAVVHKGADGTDANQANHNLLLSERAEIDAKPELEIYADDVKCSHGTTVGQLDEKALHYLRTRGIGKREATQILTHAFAADLVERAPIPSTRNVIRKLVDARLNNLSQDDAS